MPRALVYPKGLRVRGKRLWRDVLDIRPRLGPGERVLLEEACRLVDRLEELNELLVGGKPFTVESTDGEVFTLVVNEAHQEARLSTVALRQVLMSLQLDKLQVPEPKAPPAPPAPAPVEEQPAPSGDPIDEITRRRQGRERDAG